MKQTKLTEHGFTAYQPQELESLMVNAGLTDVTTVTADGGANNGTFYCTSGLARE